MAKIKFLKNINTCRKICPNQTGDGLTVSCERKKNHKGSHHWTRYGNLGVITGGMDWDDSLVEKIHMFIDKLGG